jgi:hypothetical protein
MKPENPLRHLLIGILFSTLLSLTLPIELYAQEDEMQDAVITLNFQETAEAGKTITAYATDSEGNPAEELDLFFFVKRTFSMLPIGDAFNTTDEEGKVTVIFPEDLPGDKEGNVVIVVKIMESDLYNDLSIESTKNWGVVPAYDHSEEQRSLVSTSANAPWSLVLSTSLLILATWYIYWYIIYVLYKISKIEPEEQQ